MNETILAYIISNYAAQHDIYNFLRQNWQNQINKTWATQQGNQLNF